LQEVVIPPVLNNDPPAIDPEENFEPEFSHLSDTFDDTRRQWNAISSAQRSMNPESDALIRSFSEFSESVHFIAK
jgi:hypothetical protein